MVSRASSTLTTNSIVLQVPGVTPVTKYGRMDKGPQSVWEAPKAPVTASKGFEAESQRCGD